MEGDDGFTVIEVTTGGVTVKVIAALVMLPEAAVILVAPVATPVARPVLEMVATALVLLAQVKVRPVRMLPFLSLAVAVNCWVAKTAMEGAAGDTVMVATVAVSLLIASGCAEQVGIAMQVETIKPRRELVRAPRTSKHPRTQEALTINHPQQDT